MFVVKLDRAHMKNGVSQQIQLKIRYPPMITFGKESYDLRGIFHRLGRGIDSGHWYIDKLKDDALAWIRYNDSKRQVFKSITYDVSSSCLFLLMPLLTYDSKAQDAVGLVYEQRKPRVPIPKPDLAVASVKPL